MAVLVVSQEVLDLWVNNRKSNGCIINFIIVLFNSSFLGIMTSLYLKRLNSVYRIFCSAFQIIFTAFLSYLLLGISINFITINSIIIVITALVIYAKNPLHILTQSLHKGHPHRVTRIDIKTRRQSDAIIGDHQ